MKPKRSSNLAKIALVPGNQDKSTFKPSKEQRQHHSNTLKKIKNGSAAPTTSSKQPNNKAQVSTGATNNNSNKIQTKTPVTCAGCKKLIKRDKFLLMANDKYWHENCLRCDRCNIRLGELGSSLFHKNDMNLCRQDYLEMFGKSGVCSLCQKIICASEMVMKARENVYHLECFACQLCGSRFCVGDKFYLCENRIVCEYDYEEHILPIQISLRGQQEVVAIMDSINPQLPGEQTQVLAAPSTMTPQPELRSLPNRSNNFLARTLGPKEINEESNETPDGQTSNLETLQSKMGDQSDETEPTINQDLKSTECEADETKAQLPPV